MRGFHLSILLLVAACSGGGGSAADWVVPTPPAEGKGEQVHISGAVKFHEIEGGFYAIQGADGVTYDPTNLPQEFRQEGLGVEVEARKRPDVMSVRQVGTIIDIERIRRR
jgi:hypothetical protein